MCFLTEGNVILDIHSLLLGFGIVPGGIFHLLSYGRTCFSGRKEDDLCRVLCPPLTRMV